MFKFIAKFFNITSATVWVIEGRKYRFVDGHAILKGMR